MSKIRFAMAIHNHQPIGNFDGVIEAAYQDSYRPFLDVLEQHPRIPISLHTSGCLMEWLVEHHPEYIDRLRKLVRRGQIEVLGGAFYEPILPMIPARDRHVQIRGYSDYLADLFGSPIRGMWVAERVWEQSLVTDIAKAGIEFTTLDDHHFRTAGLVQEELFGYFVTEDEGNLLRIFPGSEQMRYLIPFQEVDRAIGYLGEVNRRHLNALVVFADDGEKFGTWPETKAHVYERGWLARFLDALEANRHWLEVCTLSQALDTLPSAGQVYVPNCSYREMTEWALPTSRLVEYERLVGELNHDPKGARVKEFLRGGFWRNFRVKYPETHEMYARMMQVSDQHHRLCRDLPGAVGDHLVHLGRQALLRGQCNCGYWHGAFGGFYLPHLRNAIYSQLIEAENRFVEFERGPDAHWVDIQVKDLDFDGEEEVRLENEHLVAFARPARGGYLYELDVRPLALNLGASVTRRPEAYHEKIRHAGAGQSKEVASIHDRVVFKQEGLDRKLCYDRFPRKTLVDHFFEARVAPGDVQTSAARELGDFVTGKYRPSISRSADQVQLGLARSGTVSGQPVTLTKKISLGRGRRNLLVHYRLEDLPGSALHFGIELNFAALATGADDRYFYDLASAAGSGASPGKRRKLCRLEHSLDLSGVHGIGLVDEWLGIDLLLLLSTPGDLWTFPIESVSQSEGGFELVHQSVCVLPHWHIPEGTRTWEVHLSLAVETVPAQVPQLVAVG